MSEVRLVVREAHCDWSGTMHGSCADRAIAALSADPTTLEELELAVSRFAKPDANHRYFSNLRAGLNDEPYDAGLVVIDLIARMIVAETTYFFPARSGGVEYHDGKSCTDIGLPFHLADDWLISTDALNWKNLAEDRRRRKAAKPVLDARAVFYGRPMLEFLARETFAAFAKRGEIIVDKATHDSPYYDTIKKIHADWLMMPRDDLGGLCPREIALETRSHVNWDLEDRCHAWSLLRRCPPGLSESSHAYAHGGFGTHELVKYYDLVRDLLWSCWEQLTHEATTGQRPEAQTAGDFLTTEVPRLEVIREALLDTPDPEFHGRTPRSIIERERARLPEGMSGREAIHDPDCPCCQMLADMPGPMFWHLDGSAMDDELAFDLYHRTQAERDEEDRRHAEFNKKFEAERAERERLGVAYGDDRSKAIWSRSFSVADIADVPLGVRVFGVGSHLAELIVGLRAGCERDAVPPESQGRIDQLNRDFANLREILNSDDVSLAAALIDPVLDHFADSLADVASARPELAAQCEDLTKQIRALLDPPSPEPTWNPDDFGIPF